jgi:hypothetical protein
MSTSLFILSMMKPQRPGARSDTRPPSTCSHQPTGWLSHDSFPSSSSPPGAAPYPPSLGGRSGLGSPKIPSHIPAGPISHGHASLLLGPPNPEGQVLSGSQQEPLYPWIRRPSPSRIADHPIVGCQVSAPTVRSLGEPQWTPLPVCSRKCQVAASPSMDHFLSERPQSMLPVCSHEHQVTASPTMDRSHGEHQWSTHADRSSSTKSPLCMYRPLPECQVSVTGLHMSLKGTQLRPCSPFHHEFTKLAGDSSCVTDRTRSLF